MTSPSDDWKSTVASLLDERDAEQQQTHQIFHSFDIAAQRAIRAESLLRQAAEETLNGSPDGSDSRAVAALQSKIYDLTARVSAAETAYRSERQKAEKLKSSLNAQFEEMREKNRTVQLVNDEVMSLTIENNLLNEKLELLQSEHEKLVERWIARVKLEADTLNEWNERQNSI